MLMPTPETKSDKQKKAYWPYKIRSSTLYSKFVICLHAQAKNKWQEKNTLFKSQFVKYQSINSGQCLHFAGQTKDISVRSTLCAAGKRFTS